MLKWYTDGRIDYTMETIKQASLGRNQMIEVHKILWEKIQVSKTSFSSLQVQFKDEHYGQARQIK